MQGLHYRKLLFLLSLHPPWSQQMLYCREPLLQYLHSFLRYGWCCQVCIINVKFYSFLYQSTYIVKCFYKYLPNSCFHISSNCSSENAAFAGLVDGSVIIGSLICSAWYFLYNLPAVFPFVKTARIDVCATMLLISAGTTFRILLSLEPMISQARITS